MLKRETIVTQCCSVHFCCNIRNVQEAATCRDSWLDNNCLKRHLEGTVEASSIPHSGRNSAFLLHRHCWSQQIWMRLP